MTKKVTSSYFRSEYSLVNAKGKNWLQMIVDNEKEDGSWMFEQLFRKLLNDGCDPNISIKKGTQNMSLLEYAETKRKSKSIKIIK